MFTVIIAAYNAEKHINETLQSLIGQTFKEWECLVILNGSLDSTESIANFYAKRDIRIKILKLDFANKSAALNFGIINAKNEWISILDADDIWTANKLEIQNNFLKEKKDIDVLGTQIQYIDESGNFLLNSPSLSLTCEEIFNNLDKGNNSIANSSVVYKKDLHKKFGYYNTELFGVEDYDWWKRLRRASANFINLPEKCLLHRIHRNSNYNSSKRQQANKNLVDQIGMILLHSKVS